jgi:hypothetical protein
MGHAEPFSQLPYAAVSEQDEPDVFGPGRGLVDQSRPQRSLLMALEGVGPAKAWRS